MAQHDSGVIDLFAIQAEHKARVEAAPSGPLPALSVDQGDDGIDIDVDGFLDRGAWARRRMALIGGAMGVLALTAVLVFAARGPAKPETTVAATQALVAPQAITEPSRPAPVEVVSIPTPVPAKDSAVIATPTPKPKADYDRASAKAAYAASKKKPVSAPKKPVRSGVKLQKIQSSGVP